jgi:hypothetical protein
MSKPKPLVITRSVLERLAAQYDSLAIKHSAVEFVKFIDEERSTHRKFTEFERQYIIKHYQKMTLRMIAECLGRSPEVIRVTAIRMGLHKQDRRIGNQGRADVAG